MSPIAVKLNFSKIILVVTVLLMTSVSVIAQENFSGMDNERMEALLHSNASEVSGSPGNWEVYVANRTVYVITHEEFNRMRIISPIVEEETLEYEHLKLLLEANFDRALDSKYSIYNGYVWSTFTHPLSELTNEQFVDALHQVVNLVNNFGTTFSSSKLQLGGQQDTTAYEEE